MEQTQISDKPKGSPPQYKAQDGTAVWMNKLKDNSEYVNIKLPDGKVIKCYKYKTNKE